MLPLQVRLARAAELARLAQLGDDRVSGCPLAAACTRLTRPLANHPPLAVPPRRDRHPGGGQRQLPRRSRLSVTRRASRDSGARPHLFSSRSARADRRTPGIACTLGDRAPSPTLTSPRPRPAAPPPGQRPDAGSDGNLDAVSFVQRASVVSDPRGAFQHVAIFKNIVVAADGDDSARLHIFDVRDWSEKQVIRVGKVSEEVTGRPKAGEGLAPATVSALAFDGTTVAVGTHQGFAHTWRLAEHEGTRGYVRLLQPLKVDAGPITKLHVSGDAQLLTAYSAAKRTFVAWELDTGKLRGAFNVDGVARGSPLRLTANCGSVIACVHAPVPGQEPQTGAPIEPIAALLDVRTGEGGMVRDVSALAGEGDPTRVAFDGELLAVGTSAGAVVAWNVAEGYAAWKGHHRGAVGALVSVPGDPARVLSGGADRAVILWDARGHARSRGWNWAPR